MLYMSFLNFVDSPVLFAPNKQLFKLSQQLCDSVESSFFLFRQLASFSDFFSWLKSFPSDDVRSGYQSVIWSPFLKLSDVLIRKLFASKNSDVIIFSQNKKIFFSLSPQKIFQCADGSLPCIFIIDANPQSVISAHCSPLLMYRFSIRFLTRLLLLFGAAALWKGCMVPKNVRCTVTHWLQPIARDFVKSKKALGVVYFYLLILFSTFFLPVLNSGRLRFWSPSLVLFRASRMFDLFKVNKIKLFDHGANFFRSSHDFPPLFKQNRRGSNLWPQIVRNWNRHYEWLVILPYQPLSRISFGIVN